MAEMSRADEALTQATDGAPAPKVVESKPIYEVGFHIVATGGEESVSPAVEKVRAAIGNAAEFISEGFPQKMPLAYTIELSDSGKREKFNESYFGWIKFGAERETIPPLKEALNAIPEILRYLIVETVREDAATTPRRAVFSSSRLEGETIKKVVREAEPAGEVSEAELDKSLEAIVGPEEKPV